MSGRLGSTFTMTLIALVVGLTWAVLHYHRQSVAKDATILQVASERDTVRVVAMHQIRTMNLFNDIAMVSLNEKQQSQQRSKKNQKVISEALQRESCHRVMVPTDVARQLYHHADQIRHRTPRADPS